MKEVFDILAKEWPLIADAPIIAIGGSLILLAVAFTGAWRLKNAIDDGQLKEQDARIDTLKERLQLAAEREQAVQKAREELEKQVQELKANAGAPKETLGPITASVDSALAAFRTANNELQKVVSIPIEQSISVQRNVIRVPQPPS
jgi:FtsZ-binding cell division protein ZapB